MPQARPYKVPGKRSVLGHLLEGAAQTAPDVLKRMFKLQEPLSAKDAADIAYKRYLMSEGPAQRKHALDIFKLKEVQEEAIDARELEQAAGVAEAEFGREKQLIEYKGETAEEKRARAVAVAEEKKGFAQFEQGLDFGKFMFERRETSTERGLENLFRVAMTDKARADIESQKTRDEIEQNRLEIEREAFNWDTQMDRANLLYDYAKMQGDTELAYNLAEYRAGVEKALLAIQQGKKIHDFTKLAVGQVGYSSYLFYKSRADKDKEGMKAAMDSIDHWNTKLSIYAKKFDDIEIKTGKTEWIDRTLRSDIPGPLPLPEVTPPAPTEPQDIQLPSLQRTAAPAPAFPQEAAKADVTAAIKELKGGVTVPFTPQTVIVLLRKGFSPAQIEEIENGVTP